MMTALERDGKRDNIGIMKCVSVWEKEKGKDESENIEDDGRVRMTKHTHIQRERRMKVKQEKSKKDGQRENKSKKKKIKEEICFFLSCSSFTPMCTYAIHFKHNLFNF